MADTNQAVRSVVDRTASPKVSVLVPCYNVERYLEQCLDSIAAQDLADFEAICINDGSTDGTPDIIRSYMEHDSRFKMIDKPNSGYGASMNQGLEAATGEYIAILESDDFMEPDTLSSLVDVADCLGADAVKANFYFYWSKPEPRNELNQLIDDKTPEVVDPASFLKLFWYMPSIWSAIYRRDYLNANGIRFLETPGASYQDLAFTFKVWACSHRIGLVRRAFVHYRQDNEASSIHSPGKVFCVCDEFDEMERFLEAHPEMEGLVPVEQRLKFDSYFWNYWRLDKHLRRNFLKVFHQDFKEAYDAGKIDFELFYPWCEADARQIINNAPSYERWAEKTDGKRGHISQVLHYLRWGGWRLLKRRLDFHW